MKRTTATILIGLLLFSTLLFPACSAPFLSVVTASGPVTTRDYNVTDFTGVQTGGVFQMEIVPSTSYSIAVTTNENMFDYVEVTKSGSTLKLELRNGVSFVGPSTLKARIEMPELHSLSLSGASSATARGFKSNRDFRLVISGAARLDMDMETGKFVTDISGAGKAAGSLKAGDSQFRLSGAGDVQLDGSSGNTVVNASGASSAGLESFKVNNARVALSGGSRASIDVGGRLDLDLSGGSTLRYSGNPTLGTVDVTGGSSLRRNGT